MVEKTGCQGRPSVELLRDDAVRECYSFDATGARCLPEAVAFLEGTEDAVELVRLCRREGLCIVPRGAGTGFVGGSVPSRGCVVASLERMNSILDVDTKNQVALVEPGVVTARLQEAVRGFGLMYPPDPSSLESCTVGGNVATNAGGPRAVKYGVTADYVKGVEAVLGTGEVFCQLERVRKCVVGLNLVPLFVGSEGTLGIITRVLLRLVPLPEMTLTFLLCFSSLEDAGVAVERIMASGILPCALEIMDITSIECVRKYRSVDVPGGIEALLIVELDGFEDEVKRAKDALLNLVSDLCREVVEAGDEEDVERIWAVRRAISPSLMEIAPTKINEDVTVPVSRLAEALSAYREVGRRYGLPVVCFGHAGDGNIHVNIMTDRDDEVLWRKALDATRDIFMSTVALGGVLSGEHGVGLSKRPYLGFQMETRSLDIYRRVKSALDPEGIMNPGKKF